MRTYWNRLRKLNPARQLTENVARLTMDDIDQYKAFAKLVKARTTVSEMACRFGTTERLIKQSLAIANLIQPLLTTYQKNKIDAETIRLLTMASKSQQKSWLEVFAHAIMRKLNRRYSKTPKFLTIVTNLVQCGIQINYKLRRIMTKEIISLTPSNDEWLAPQIDSTEFTSKD